MGGIAETRRQLREQRHRERAWRIAIVAAVCIVVLLLIVAAVMG